MFKDAILSLHVKRAKAVNGAHRSGVETASAQSNRLSVTFCALLRSSICGIWSRRLQLPVPRRKLGPDLIDMWFAVQEIYSRHAGGQEFDKIQQILSLPTYDILDECDELLAPKFQLVYAWGSQEQLPGITERVHVLQAVLQTLDTDARVQKLLRDPMFAQVTYHKNRYGGRPEVRLLAGNHSTDARWTCVHGVSLVTRFLERLSQIYRSICRARFG